MRGLYLCDVTNYQLPRTGFEKLTSTEIILFYYNMHGFIWMLLLQAALFVPNR
jgi:hypothetical protein